MTKTKIIMSSFLKWICCCYSHSNINNPGSDIIAFENPMYDKNNEFVSNYEPAHTPPPTINYAQSIYEDNNLLVPQTLSTGRTTLPYIV